MGRVIYDSKLITPSPLVDISKQYEFNGDGEKIGSTVTLTLQGTIVAWRGSPNSSGVFDTTGNGLADEVVSDTSRLSAIIKKQNALRELFSDDGKTFEIQALDGTTPLRCNPRVVSMNFPEGTWYQRSEYSITLEADRLYPEEEDVFTDKISAAEESWQIQEIEDQFESFKNRTYQISHTVSAVGKRFYKENGELEMPSWQQARNWVLPKLGFDEDVALSSGVLNLPAYYTGYNHMRTQSHSETTGSFEVTESWVVASGTSMESFTLETSDDLATGLTRVSMQGTITGLETRDSNLNILTTKYDNASGRFDNTLSVAHTRAQAWSGETLNVTPLTQNVGRNPDAGTITYTFEYDTRPSNLIANARTEAISVNDLTGGEAFAQIFVLGRTAGPVLQDLNTKPSPARRTLEINISVPIPSGNALERLVTYRPNNNPDYSTDLQAVIDAVDPGNLGVYRSFKEPLQENWDHSNGNYSLVQSWTYEP